MAPQMCQIQMSDIQRSRRQVSMAEALLPMDIIDPSGFLKLYKEIKSCLSLPYAQNVFKIKEKLHQLSFVSGGMASMHQQQQIPAGTPRHSLPWDPLPPKTRYRRPPGRLVLTSLALSDSVVTGREGRVEGVPWAHQLNEGSWSSVQLFLMLWLLPCPEALCCALCLRLPAVPLTMVWFSLPNGHGWQAGLNHDAKYFPLCWKKEALSWCSGSYVSPNEALDPGNEGQDGHFGHPLYLVSAYLIIKI